MEWNHRARYLLWSIVAIVGKLLNIIFILISFILAFAFLGFIFWSDSSQDISAVPYHYSYFRSIGQSITTIATLTTTVNFPDCMIDYVGSSFTNFAFFVIFISLSVSFALQLLLSSVYNSYQAHLNNHYSTHILNQQSALAQAFQHLCDSNMTISRQRWRFFMRVYNNHDSSHFPAQNALLHSDIHADLLFSICNVKRHFLSDFHNLKPSFMSGDVVDELRANELIASICETPCCFADFSDLCSLIRYNISVKPGQSLSLIKRMNGQEISLADVLSRVACASDGSIPTLMSFSPHSSSYARQNRLSVRSTSQDIHAPQHDSSLRSLMDTCSEFQISLMIPVKPSRHSKLRTFADRIYGLRAVRLLVNVLILVQFALCLAHFEMAHAAKMCQRDAAHGDLWLTCSLHAWYKIADVQDLDFRFKLAYFFVSFVLLVDISVQFWLQGTHFVKTSFGHYKWNKGVQFAAQLSIFIRDVVLLSSVQHASDSFVYQPEFAFFSVIKLFRFWRLNKLLPEVSSTLSLLKKLYPILKSYFWIVYFLFFTFSILGMSLFSYAVSNLGIALYPTKQQYIDFYNPNLYLEYPYPNGNNPGLFNCNRTDVFGNSESCGQVRAAAETIHIFGFDTLFCRLERNLRRRFGAPQI